MFDDLTGGDEADDGRPPVGPAFIPNAPMGPRELLVAEEMHRMADFPGANEIIFTAIDEETGEETWDKPMPPDFADSAKQWQKIMKWPTVPTVAEAAAFQLNARYARMAAWWDRLRAAKAADDAERPAPRATKPKG